MPFRDTSERGPMCVPGSMTPSLIRLSLGLIFNGAERRRHHDALARPPGNMADFDAVQCAMHAVNAHRWSRGEGVTTVGGPRRAPRLRPRTRAADRRGS